MRELRRLAWTAAIAVVFSGSAFGQQQTGGSLGTTVAPTTGTTGQSGGTTSGGGTGSAAGSTEIQGTSLITTPAAPKINAPSTLNITSSTAGTNVFQKTYANPYHAGSVTVYNYSATAGTPGGFGSPLGGNTGGRTGAAATTGGRGTGSAGGQDPGGTIVPLPQQIAYPAQLQFQVPVVPTQVFTDIRTDLDRSTMIANPRAIQVVMDGPNVILRGSVKDNDEYRLVESVVRITPGVREIKNELTYPK